MKHGSLGAPGYRLLHPGFHLGDVLGLDGSESLTNELDAAHGAGFSPKAYNPFADRNHPDFDADEELGADEINWVDWEGLSRYVASGEGGQWFANFEDSRRIRRAANELAGIGGGEHDSLLGSGKTDANSKMAAVALMTGVATAPKLRQTLYRGSWVEGGDADAIESALRAGDLDFGLVSFTNSRRVADHFADPSLFQSGESQGGVRVMFEVEPGAQGVLGHIFPNDLSAEIYDEDLVNFTPSVDREVITGGKFKVGHVRRDGDSIHVTLQQQYAYSPTTGRTQ